MTFKDLHKQRAALVLCNVWDARSALLAGALGFQAIGTSSAAIACMLGYDDGENISFAELCYIVKRIRAVCKLPLTVDIEHGYGNNIDDIANNISALAELGVVGVNIEDSIVNGPRGLIDADIFADALSHLVAELDHRNIKIFINVRSDAYLTACSNSLHEALKRAELYQSVGADGIFIPGVVESDEIACLSQNCAVPLSVMCMPGLPDFEVLSALGVKRISMGNFLFEGMITHLKTDLSTILKHQSFAAVV